ncbi:glycoside hydrolase family 43 protein [Zopfia rhizophila CBS 207.26]|uniref:Glycoside hydrolase family 43 protein n=1 Tax=Zopfia rhizophila CBS 207.26 TaxID=1314779 RepID=A0A6A6EGW4_9PEZI|nr:glycoside hydrolase family 43 protein [Zopfia rhizophila CBS 207.26]
MDFPDPAVIGVGNMWYVFGTNNGKYNVQITKPQGFNTWNVLAKDALPNLPSWVNADLAAVCAPDVSQLDKDTFLLYYSAALAPDPAYHCIGAATSANIVGLYSPMDMPLICPDPNGNGAVVDSMINPSGQGGAIDASGFKDADGTRYIVYKVDGNSLGSRGNCNNGNRQEPTPIMLVHVDANDVTPLGQAATLLDHARINGPPIEAPSITRRPDGSYALFFSSNCDSFPLYNVTWATASTISGPYSRNGPLLVTGVQGLTAHCGVTVAADGTPKI